MNQKTNQLQIKTPEGIVFSLLLAGPTTRFMALGIDLAVIMLVTLVVAQVTAMLNIVLPGPAAGLGVVAFFVIQIGYGITLEWFWRGQTIGKRLLRLRVVDEAGLRLQFNQIVIRNLLRFIDSLPVFYLLGGLACLLSRRGQRLGDLAANTIVVRMPRTEEPDLDQLLGEKYNSFRDYPHICARLRKAVSSEEARIALEALLRRDDLDPQARVALFDDIAGHLRDLVPFPEDATLGLTDEQYIRNAVDIIFRTSDPRINRRRPEARQ